MPIQALPTSAAGGGKSRQSRPKEGSPAEEKAESKAKEKRESKSAKGELAEEKLGQGGGKPTLNRAVMTTRTLTRPRVDPEPDDSDDSGDEPALNRAVTRRTDAEQALNRATMEYRRVRRPLEDAGSPDNVQTAQGGGMSRGKGGGLSAAARRALPKSDFAVPSKAPGSGSYPVDTPARARNAKSRVAQFGTAAEKAQVASKVASRYPSIGQGGGKGGGKPAEGSPAEERTESKAKEARESKSVRLEKAEEKLGKGGGRSSPPVGKPPRGGLAIVLALPKAVAPKPKPTKGTR